MADPGFLEEGSQKQKWGRRTIILPSFPLKLHENEKIDPRGAYSWCPPLGPQMDRSCVRVCKVCVWKCAMIMREHSGCFMCAYF